LRIVLETDISLNVHAIDRETLLNQRTVLRHDDDTLSRTKSDREKALRTSLFFAEANSFLLG
jgi:hypothetical protein